MRLFFVALLTWYAARERAEIIPLAKPKMAFCRWAPSERLALNQRDQAQSAFFATYMASQLAGYSVSTEREQGGNKTRRALPLAAQMEHGFVRLQQGNWNTPFIDECPCADTKPSLRE